MLKTLSDQFAAGSFLSLTQTQQAAPLRIFLEGATEAHKRLLGSCSLLPSTSSFVWGEGIFVLVSIVGKDEGAEKKDVVECHEVVSEQL